MIAYIDGLLKYKTPSSVIMDVGGIGYEIKISLNTSSTLQEGQKCKLNTYLHVKEDSHTLFGFREIPEKKLFLDLISISGVGPNTAMMVLSYLSTDELKEAIASEDTRTIQSIKGIGAKTAQRIILELKDKVKKDSYGGEMPNISGGSRNTIKNEALSALVTLGIAKASAEKSLDTILKKGGNALTLEDLIKQALKIS